MIKEFSLRRDGEMKLSEHFKVKEFACKDNSDKILIDVELVAILEDLREYFNSPITITSGYRTEAYNKKCGGANNSLHCLGKAADIKVSGVSPIAVALYCESVLLKCKGGIGLYQGQGFTHIDTRDRATRWVQPTNSSSYRVVDKIYRGI